MVVKYQTLLKEYAKSDDIWDLLSLLQAGQSILMIVYDNGDAEFLDEEYYKEEGRDTLVKKRGKQVAKIYKLSGEEIMG